MNRYHYLPHSQSFSRGVKEVRNTGQPRKNGRFEQRGFHYTGETTISNRPQQSASTSKEQTLSLPSAKKPLHERSFYRFLHLVSCGACTTSQRSDRERVAGPFTWNSQTTSAGGGRGSPRPVLSIMTNGGSVTYLNPPVNLGRMAGLNSGGFTIPEKLPFQTGHNKTIRQHI